MLFDFKSTVLYGLVAVSHASPVLSQEEKALGARAKAGSFLCPDGTTIVEHDVKAAFRECKTHGDGQVGNYPAYLADKIGSSPVFANVTGSPGFREFPIVVGSTFTGGKVYD
jgi:hypothetical protein